MEVLSGWYSPGLDTLRNDPAVRRRMSVVYQLLLEFFVLGLFVIIGDVRLNFSAVIKRGESGI